MRASRYTVFAIVSFTMVVNALQFSMVSVALSAINEDLEAPLRWSSWILTAYMIGQVVSMPMAGRLAERFGTRTMFASGIAVFALASLACALSGNVYFLIAARAVQGVAGGWLMPSGMGIIGETFAGDRTRWIGLLGSTVPAGSVVAPSIGGLIVDHASWRWTFGMNLPLGLLALAAILFVVPRGKRTTQQRPFDIQGVALLGLTATAFIFALTELGRSDGAGSPAVIASAFAVSIVALIALARRELNTPDPAIDLDLLRRREFLVVNVLALLFGAGVFGMFNVIPLYSQVAYGLTATESGALVTPRAIAMVGASMLAAMLLPRTGYRKPVIVGTLAMAGLMVLLSLGIRDPDIAGVQLSSFAWLSVLVGLAGLAFGSMNPSLNNASIDLAPDRIPAIAGLRGMFMSLGGVIGVTLIFLAATRAGTPADGIQGSFWGLAIVFVAASGLAFGIPEMRRSRLAKALEPAAAPVPGETAASAPGDAARRTP